MKSLITLVALLSITTPAMANTFTGPECQRVYDGSQFTMANQSSENVARWGDQRFALNQADQIALVGNDEQNIMTCIGLGELGKVVNMNGREQMYTLEEYKGDYVLVRTDYVNGKVVKRIDGIWDRPVVNQR